MTRKKTYTTGVGSYVLDKTYPLPVGRIRVRSGLTDPDQIDHLKWCVQKLWASGRHEELISYRDRRLDTSTLVRLVERNEQLDPDHDFLTQPLFPTLRSWVSDHYTNERTRINRTYLVDIMEQRVVLGRDLLVGDLPDGLRELKRIQQKRGQTTPFTNSKQLVQKFVKENTRLEQDSTIYRELKRVKDFTSHQKLTMGNKTSKNPLSSPSELDKWFHDLEVPTDLKEWISFMCLTGVHRQEILNGLQEEQSPIRHLRAFGTKTRGRFDRVIPLVQEIPHHPFPSKKRMTVTVKKMGGRSEYDLRRTFSVWCLRAGIPQLHIASYMGHKVGQTQTTQYQREEVFKWIPEDVKTLKTWVQQQISDPTQTPTPVLPVTSFHELGDTRQHLGLDEIARELDRILDGWYRDGFMRKRYRLRSHPFVVVGDG